MKEFFKNTGKITGIHTENISLGEPFLNFASRFAPLPGTVVLMSGGELDCARYHILGAKPWFTFTGRAGKMTIKTDDQPYSFSADPFETLRALLDHFNPGNNVPENRDMPRPLGSGLLGYLSYDLKDRIEKLARTSVDDLCLPHICFFAPSIIIVHDRHTSETKLHIPRLTGHDKNFPDETLGFFRDTLRTALPPGGNFTGKSSGFISNFKKANYLDTIEKIREYIASGHVYQVNMSQRFEMNFNGDTFALFQNLYDKNPAPFFAYINAGDHQIVSTSPERFLLREGERIETRPIKGTRPRGKNDAEDKRLGRELENSKKDDAELSMIVDLLRNDIGKVCRAGSVKVARHKMLEKYQNVFHLVSLVEGRLDKDCDSVDIVKATFPGGSITGCPKIRSMEIIDELEPNRRHIYTGSIGYISFHDTMDLSIAIRTATIYNGKIIFSVGGGIVFDSDPSDEFDETLHKGKTLMEVFSGKEKTTGDTEYAWVNGCLGSMDSASVSLADPGFQYGFGLFETIRVNQGKPLFLDGHIERFNTAWKKFFSSEPPDLSWDEIIRQVLFKNKLLDQTAVVKIAAAKGGSENPPLKDTLLVTAKPYVHRLEVTGKQGLDIAIYPEPRENPLADYKTMNYMYYFFAGTWAKKKGADEALILNPDGSISETNTANLLLINDGSVIFPVSSHVLPGTMQKRVFGLLKEWGYEVEERRVFPEEFIRESMIIATNSLMGAVPVLSIDGKQVTGAFDLCHKINGMLF